MQNILILMESKFLFYPCGWNNVDKQCCVQQLMSHLYLDAKMSPNLQVNSGTEAFCIAIFFLSASWYLLPATLFLLVLA